MRDEIRKTQIEKKSTNAMPLHELIISCAGPQMECVGPSDGVRHYFRVVASCGTDVIP